MMAVPSRSPAKSLPAATVASKPAMPAPQNVQGAQCRQLRHPPHAVTSPSWTRATEVPTAVKPSVPRSREGCDARLCPPSAPGTRKPGITTLVLRDSDANLSLDDRAFFANTTHAAVYIALHAASSGHGVRIYTALLPYADATDDDRGPFRSWPTAQASSIQ